MKYIKYYTKRSQYTNTDFSFPFVGFRGVALDGTQINEADVDTIRSTHSLHLFTEDMYIKCEYIPSEEIRLYNNLASDNIVSYVYNNKRIGVSNENPYIDDDEKNVLVFDEVPDENIVVYFLIKDQYRIPRHMFDGCHKLISVTFTNNLISISDYAFYGCKRLQEIDIPDTCQHIGKYAFAQCNRLTRIHFPEKLQGIGKLAFQINSQFLQNITFENVYPAFSKVSNKHGILFKHIKNGKHSAKTCKNINLCNTFSPDYFSEMNMDEKIAWSNLLAGNLLGNIFYDGNDLETKTNTRHFYFVIPNGIKQVNNIVTLPARCSFTINNHMYDISSKNSNADVMINVYKKFAHLRRIHIPNSVSDISRCIPNIIRPLNPYIGNTNYNSNIHIKFYTDKVRKHPIGISRSVFTYIANYCIRENSWSVGKYTKYYWDVLFTLFIATHLYNKVYARHCGYNQIFMYEHLADFRWSKRKKREFKLTSGEMYSILPMRKHRFMKGDWNNYSKYIKGVYDSNYLPLLMPFTRSFITNRKCEHNKIYYTEIRAYDEAGAQVIMKLNYNFSNFAGPKQIRQYTYDVYSTYHAKVEDGPRSSKGYFSTGEIIDRVTLYLNNIHVNPNHEGNYTRSKDGSAHTEGMYAGTWDNPVGGNLIKSYNKVTYRVKSYVKQIFSNGSDIHMV